MRLLSVLGALVCASTLAFGIWSSSLREGEDALIQRRYAAAAAHLEQALTDEPAEVHDRVLLLLGRARWLAGDHDGAIAAYRQLLADHPQSLRCDKARLQQADVLAEARRFREAAALYKIEIERLTGPERKEEVAETYLGLAAKAEGAEPPDHARAVTFYDLALDLGLSAATGRTVRLRAAEATLAAGDAAKAIARFGPLVEELRGEAGLARAMLGLGRAKVGAGDRSGARTVFRDLIAAFPAAAEAGDAAWEIAASYGLPLTDPSHLPQLRAALARLAQQWPEHVEAKRARFTLAASEIRCGRSEDGLASLRAFVRDSEGLGLEDRPLAQAQIGDVLARQDKLDEAIAAWREYLTANPAHGEWERVQRAIVDAEFALAEHAFGLGRDGFPEARERYAAFAAAHPLDERNPLILFRLGEMLAIERDFDAARAAFARCVAKYPGKDASSHAQYRIGEILERDTFNYDAALAAYREVTWGPWERSAKHRIAAMTQKSLAVRTDRSFRTGEPAAFRVVSRNIEKLRVRVYRLDLETWFRATYLADSVERLDIEIIAADRTFESVVPEYQRYRETERDVDVGFGEAGAYVVKVDDQELEATTMVLVTDLALIAKCSRHEFFVLTQDLKAERVAPGVRVILADGTRIIAEGVTGPDGAWRYRGDELRSSAELRAFAVAESGSGAGSVDLSGLGFTPGLTPKAFLFTDRPAYQPGQVVHAKGIVREVENGSYRLPAAAGYRASITAPSGRVIAQHAIELSDLGTFALDLQLPEQAEQGTWQVRCDRGPATTEAWSAAFEVARYELPELLLESTLDRDVVFRGEQIAGRFVLRHTFGEPAVGKTVSYLLRLPSGGEVHGEGVSNAEGAVPFSFDTREFGEEGVAAIVAWVAEGGARLALWVPVVTTELSPALATLRDVYLTGEPLTVDVTLRDRSGKPAGRSGILRLMRRTVTRGAVAEVEVARAEFTTDAERGEAHVPLTASDGGQHVVRLECEDRFGNLVDAALPVEVSGDDDEVKLRILSERERYEVGDEVRVRVVNRAGARLALRTSQGDGVLDYETLRLPAGESELVLRLDARHAPNFALALAMIDGRDLRLAESEFVVDRDLELELRPVRDELEPGATAEVEVRTRDAEGRPVAAEVAIGLVDESLFAVFPDETPAIGAYFWGARRETAFRTVSSCGWRYDGRTTRASSELVAEERRRAEVAVVDRAMGDEVRPGADEFFMGSRVQASGEADGSAPRTARLRTELMILGRDARGRLPARSDAKSVEGGLSAFDANAWNSAVGLGANKGPGLARFFADHSLELGEGPDRPRVAFGEFGGWLSSVRTDENGRATVRLELPDSTTRWRITARAVTAATDVGAARSEVRATKPVHAALAAPGFLVEGDAANGTVRVHNGTGKRVDVEVGYRPDGGEPIELRGSAEAGHDFEHAVALDASTAGERRFELVARATARGPGVPPQLVAAGDDSVAAGYAVAPFGVERRVGRAGKVAEQVAFRLGLPAGRDYTGVRLSIEIGPGGARDLIAAALGFGDRPQRCVRVDATNLSVASRGLAAVAVLDHVARAGVGTEVDRHRLEAVAAAALASLVSAQADDGALAWVGRRNADVAATAQAVRFLAAMRRRGVEAAAAPLDKASDWLLGAVRRADAAQRVQAALALAEAGRERFETLNSLQRQAGALELDSVARLALAWLAAGRAEKAGELAAALRSGLTAAAAADAAAVEAAALAATVLLRLDPNDATAAAAIERLVAQRRGASWGTPAATAAAIGALVAAGGEDMAAAGVADCEVVVNGQAVAALDGVDLGTLRVFEVPAETVAVDGNRIEIRLRGRGTAHYRATLAGFARGFEEGDRNDELIRVARDYLPALRRHGTTAIEPGFSVVAGRHDSFENRMTQLAVGDSGRVRTRFWLRRESDRDRLSPLVVEEPLPAGVAVVPGSVEGAFDDLRIEPDRLVLFYRPGIWSDQVRYEVRGRFAGRYRALPTVVFSAARPDQVAYGGVSELAVLPRGERTADEYRLTPDELYGLGKAWFDAGDHARAAEHLTALAGWQLRDEIASQVARMMLFASIEAGDAKAVVRYFEELKDRYPNLVIPFDEIVAVGQSYVDIGEFEAGLLVFRATAEASFIKEAQIATTLEQLGETKAAMRFLHDLLAKYPDLNTMRQSLYGIGQKRAALAAAIPDGARVDERVGTRDSLRADAVRTFREFLITYPEDPLAGEVSFAWATTLVEGDDLRAALAVAESALERYPGSPLEDELLYTVGFARFALGEVDEAFAALRRVATDEFARSGGGRGASENRKHAIYLEGQVHHALGRPQEALAAYDRVRDDFSDAQEAADYFRRKVLELPEVSTVGLADEAVVTLTCRNLRRVAVEIYRVDLMRLYVLRKSLNDIHDVTLHGIRPQAEREVELATGEDLREREVELRFDLAEPGAYLVVARSDDLIASGMLLRSSIEVDVQEDADAGRVRVNAERGGKCLTGAHVKVVGSGDSELRSGDTDLRGVFVADGLVGKATVIVRRGDEFAFFRGDEIHQPGRYRPELQAPSAGGGGGRQPEQSDDEKQFNAWDNNTRANGLNRQRQVEWIEQNVLNVKQRGVEVHRTK